MRLDRHEIVLGLDSTTLTLWVASLSTAVQYLMSIVFHDSERLHNSRDVKVFHLPEVKVAVHLPGEVLRSSI